MVGGLGGGGWGGGDWESGEPVLSGPCWLRSAGSKAACLFC